jgi:hypothetical protein
MIDGYNDVKKYIITYHLWSLDNKHMSDPLNQSKRPILHLFRHSLPKHQTLFTVRGKIGEREFGKGTCKQTDGYADVGKLLIEFRRAATVEYSLS